MGETGRKQRQIGYMALLLLVCVASGCSFIFGGISWQPIADGSNVIRVGDVSFQAPHGGKWWMASHKTYGGYMQEIVLQPEKKSGHPAKESMRTYYAMIKPLVRGQFGTPKELSDFMQVNFVDSMGKIVEKRINVDTTMQYDAVSFDVTSRIPKSSSGKPVDLELTATGFWFFRPGTSTIFEVVVSERYPVGDSRSLSGSDLGSFFKSFRFH